MNSESLPDPANVRAFLVENPCWVPGAHGLAQRSTHEPQAWSVLFQSPLRVWSREQDSYVLAEGVKVPDFMWLARNKHDLRPVLIEVGLPTDQWLIEVAKWQAWFDHPQNQISFCADFGMPRANKNFSPEFLLVGIPHCATVASGKLNCRTLHDLRPELDSALFGCATKLTDHYRAISVSPLLKLGPASAVGFSRVVGLADAVEKNKWISPERKRFLIERLPFWIRWPGTPKRLPALISSDDWE